jgi:hypothetical protein
MTWRISSNGRLERLVVFLGQVRPESGLPMQLFGMGEFLAAKNSVRKISENLD